MNIHAKIKESWNSYLCPLSLMVHSTNWRLSLSLLVEIFPSSSPHHLSLMDFWILCGKTAKFSLHCVAYGAARLWGRIYKPLQNDDKVSLFVFFKFNITINAWSDTLFFFFFFEINLFFIFRFHHQRVPLVILVCGTACVGKSTIATQLAQRLNLPNVLQASLFYISLV